MSSVIRWEAKIMYTIND